MQYLFHSLCCCLRKKTRYLLPSNFSLETFQQSYQTLRTSIYSGHLFPEILLETMSSAEWTGTVKLYFFYDGLWYPDQSCQVLNLFQNPPLDKLDIIKLEAFVISIAKSGLTKVYSSANFTMISLLSSSLKVNDITALVRKSFPTCEMPLCFGHDWDFPYFWKVWKDIVLVQLAVHPYWRW